MLFSNAYPVWLARFAVAMSERCEVVMLASGVVREFGAVMVCSARLGRGVSVQEFMCVDCVQVGDEVLKLF